jgi:glycosyltransferase involved in cell wall biosynthesis
VITSNNSSLPEVVGEAAITIDPKDEDALCQAMLDICNDECLRQRLSSLSIERSKIFDWAKTSGETLGAYRKALQY